MSISHLTSSARLQWWREIRNKNLTTIEDVLLEFRSLVPERRYIDYYSPNNWPNPFEIVSNGHLDVSGISLVIAATLHYKKIIKSDIFDFHVISRNTDGEIGLFLKHDKTYVNFISGQVNTEQFVLDNGIIFENHQITYNQLMN
jgi:hypothetical protein